ncbi:MAG TPA: ABC transporter ATP-binding protein [Pseudothermotoga sp.]|mgnify:CR=1 FL=1|nr:ABC transporter ATP-binding protein [Pseudothermotoga sp.]
MRILSFSKSARHLQKFERKYRRYYPLFFFLEMLFLIINILTPIFIKNTIDSAFYKGNIGGIILFSGLYLLILSFQSFIMYKLNYSVARYLINNSRAKESKSAYAKILSLPTNILSSQNVNNYLSIFVKDIPKIATGIYLGKLQFYFNFGFFAIVLGILFILNVKLTLAVLISAFMFYLSTSALKKLVIRSSQKDRENYQKFMKRTKESIEGIFTLKQYPNSRLIENFTNTSAKKWSKTNILARMANGLSSKNSEINKGIGNALVIGFGVYLLWKGEISVGTLVAYNSYMNWIYDILRMMITGLTMFFSSVPNWENFVNIFSMPFERASGVKIEKFEKLEITHVEFRYNNETKILSDLHFRLNRGDKVAIVGSSGAGKSTFVSLFNRFLSPTKGKIFINGISIEEYSLSSLRKNIIVVHSNDYLFDTSIRNNITLFEDFPEKEINRVLEICECRFVKDMENGIDTVIGEKGIKLSEGQRQRIILARALIRKPQILILDEITSGIDSETEERILERILKEIDTVVIISHRLSTIRKAQKIYVMDNGCFVDSGTHDELMEKSSTYRKIVENQLTT